MVAPALVLVAAVVLAPVAASLANGLPLVTSSPSTTSSIAPGLDAVVTWDGQNVSSANSPSHTISIEKGHTALVNFSYIATIASGAGNASLEVLYLGIVLTTSKVSTHEVTADAIPETAFTNWIAQINWSFGPLYDALEGVFQFTASLQNATGATIWSESFYVFAKAPYLLESGAVIVLLILTVLELYWGVSSIREARRGARPPKSGPAPPATPPPSVSPAPPEGSAGAAPPPGPGASGGSP